MGKQKKCLYYVDFNTWRETQVEHKAMQEAYELEIDVLRRQLLELS
ncbi:hypothetical protein GOV11_00900 [Candidatus Woesearchaeota archaeon]|nr:hypothetical protein [Candidatus Woesearchaeota archaeon]